MNEELRNFYSEFFETLGAKELKTDKQLLAILDKYTSWNSSQSELDVNVPDEIKDKFKDFLEKAGVLVEEGSYATGYANMSTTNDLIDETEEYLSNEYDKEDFESFKIPSYVKEDILYLVEPGIDPKQGGIRINTAKFKNSVSFDEIKKIFELSDKDFIAIFDDGMGIIALYITYCNGNIQNIIGDYDYNTIRKEVDLYLTSKYEPIKKLANYIRSLGPKVKQIIQTDNIEEDLLLYAFTDGIVDPAFNNYEGIDSIESFFEDTPEIIPYIEDKSLVMNCINQMIKDANDLIK